MNAPPLPTEDSLLNNNMTLAALLAAMGTPMHIPIPLSVQPAPPPPPPETPAATETDTTTTDASAETPPIVPWAERCLFLPARGFIRLLTPPPDGDGSGLWDHDHTYSEWMQRAEAEPEARAVFEANQRARWLARTVWLRLTQRIWRRRTQCNVDMIDMAEIPDADAVLMTDTSLRTIYRFHRRDLYNNLLSNICMSEEMLPNPRVPRNPWTNVPLTYGQTVGVCHALLQDYARHRRCPPVLFSAFWAAGFDVKRFATESASLLAQHAITTYFKDINEHNHDTIADTIYQLLMESGVRSTPVAVRRWLRTTPLTDGHREWLQMARDYTLYMNLHVQVRPAWHTEDMIHRDVRRLHQRVPITDSPGPRVRLLRTMSGVGAGGEGDAVSTTGATGGMFAITLNGIGGDPHQSLASLMEQLQNSLFRGRG